MLNLLVQIYSRLITLDWCPILSIRFLCVPTFYKIYDFFIQSILGSCVVASTAKLKSKLIAAYKELRRSFKETTTV